MKNDKSLQGTVSELFFQTYAISHKYTFVKGVSDYYVLDREGGQSVLYNACNDHQRCNRSIFYMAL